MNDPRIRALSFNLFSNNMFKGAVKAKREETPDFSSLLQTNSSRCIAKEDLFAGLNSVKLDSAI